MFDTKPKEQGINKILLLSLIGCAVLLIVAIATGGYYYHKYDGVKKDASTKQGAEDEEKRVIGKVQKLYNTPNETPSIVQVQDQTKVKNQAFFKDAKNGDYVLVYQTAKIAILYRESNNKIINTGPLTLPNASSADNTANSN